MFSLGFEFHWNNEMLVVSLWLSLIDEKNKKRLLIVGIAIYFEGSFESFLKCQESSKILVADSAIKILQTAIRD